MSDFFSMEPCARCDASENEVRLYDAIYEGRMSSICERCSIIENIPIIKKPAAAQLKESEQGTGVLPRMKRLSGIKDDKPDEIYFREDKLKELESKPELEIPEQEKLNLIEHFHWAIMKERRRKGLTPEKLAEVLGESSTVVQMIEKGKLPENAEVLIRKLEQFFQIKLRKITETERFLREQQRKQSQQPVLLNQKGEELEIVPEEKIKLFDRESENNEIELESKEQTQEQIPKQNNLEVQIEIPEEEIIDIEDTEIKEKKGLDQETGEFNISKADINEINISDLKDLSRKKIEATKRERVEEARKMAEKDRLIEAKKEELRLRKEKESSELNQILGGTELIGGNPEKEKEIHEEDFDEELI